ncbi:MAG: BTAD domain-containing putative transcriptional regulator [Dongiaceae bacterium]
MELLWGDRDEEQARASLRQALAELRRILGEPSPFRSDRETIAFDASVANVDAVEFVRLAEAGDFARAAALYRGELLDGLNLPNASFNDWLGAERRRLHDVAIHVLSHLVAIQSGETAISTAQRLLELDPLREESHRTLMSLYLSAGERAQALRQYQTCYDCLQKELGVKPEPETEKLLKKIQDRKFESSRPAMGVEPPTAVRAANTITRTDSVVVGPRGWWRIAIAIIALVTALSVAAYILQSRRPAPPTAASPEAALGLPVVLVLPFRNLTGDPAQDNMALGIAEDLRDQLWNYPEFQVVSGTTADRVAGTGAHFIIEGAIRRTDARMVVTAQLVAAATGVHLWSTRFQEPAYDPVALEKAVAVRLADSLSGMTGEMRQAYDGIAFSKPEAELTEYDYYVMGHSFHHSPKVERFVRAREVYERGLERYPNSVLLRVKLSLFYASSLFRGSGDPAVNTAQTTAYAGAAARSLAAGKRSRFETSYLHWAATYADRIRGDFRACMADAEAGIALNPNDAMPHADLGDQIAVCGNPDKGVEWAEKAMLQQPDGPPEAPDFHKDALSWALYLADRCGDVLPVIESMQNTPLQVLAACQVRLGRLEDARRAMAAFVEANPGWTLRDEAAFPLKMAPPMLDRWLADLRAAGMPE